MTDHAITRQYGISWGWSLSRWIRRWSLRGRSVEGRHGFIDFYVVQSGRDAGKVSTDVPTGDAAKIRGNMHVEGQSTR